MEEAGYLEAQTKQRTSYLCRDLVRPLSVSLYDRIPFLAAAAAKTTKERQRHLNNFMMEYVTWVQQGGGDEWFQEEE